MSKRQKNLGSFCVSIGLATVLALLIVSPASSTEFPGPDEFGYVSKMIESNLRDLTTQDSTVYLTLGDDDVKGPIPLPFPFLFYGVSVAEVYIVSNGFISFSSVQDYGCCQGRQIPNPSVPNNMIAGFWEDLNPTKGGTIGHATIGTEGARAFVVEFKDVPHYYNELPLTVQIILHEGSNNIELQYGAAIGDPDELPFTVGIENDDGTIGLQIVHGDTLQLESGYLISNPIMEELEVHSASVTFGKGQELDKYNIIGEFTLSEFSDGTVDPFSEEVTVKVGTHTLVIPANSFEPKSGKAGAEFRGTVDGAPVYVSIEQMGPLTFSYHTEAHKVDLSESPIPLKFRLKIGTDVGVTTIPLHGYLRTLKNKSTPSLKTNLVDREHKRNYRRFFR